MKTHLSTILLLSMLAIVIYTRIDGIDYTEGQMLIHYWKEYVAVFGAGGAALWLMKSR
jgi:hypothetical protein